jgi:hypothetical protein
MRVTYGIELVNLHGLGARRPLNIANNTLVLALNQIAQAAAQIWHVAGLAHNGQSAAFIGCVWVAWRLLR